MMDVPSKSICEIISDGIVSVSSRKQWCYSREGMIYSLTNTNSLTSYSSGIVIYSIRTTIGIQKSSFTLPYFIRDHLGSVRTIVDGSTGDVLETSDYLPFGKLRCQKVILGILLPLEIFLLNQCIQTMTRTHQSKRKYQVNVRGITRRVSAKFEKALILIPCFIIICLGIYSAFCKKMNEEHMIHMVSVGNDIVDSINDYRINEGCLPVDLLQIKGLDKSTLEYFSYKTESDSSYTLSFVTLSQDVIEYESTNATWQ